MTRITVLVNGGPSSAAGLRARALVGALGPPFQVRCVDRRAPRPLAAGRFLFQLWRQAPEICYLMDLGMAGVVAAAGYRGLRPVRVVVDTGDAVADLAEFLGRPWPVRRLARWAERTAFRLADLVIVRGDAHRQHPALRGARAVAVIPDGVETARFRPEAVPALRARHGLTDEIVTVGLQGHFTWNRRLSWGLGHELLEALDRLRDLPVKGVVIGDGPGLPRLRRRARALGLESAIVWLGRVPYEELPQSLNLLDIALLTQTNEPTSEVRTTGKLPCYMACGRYILASRVGTAARVLPEEMLVDYDGPYDPHYPTRLAGRLRALVPQRDRLVLGRRLTAAAHETFGYPGLVRRLQAALSPLAAAASASSASVLIVAPEPLRCRGGVQTLLGRLAEGWRPRESVAVVAPSEDRLTPRVLWRLGRRLDGRLRRQRGRALFCGHWTTGLLGWWARHRYGLPYVVWAHGLEVTDPRWHVLQQRIFRRAAGVLTSSRDTKRLVHQRFGLPEDRVICVWPGVDCRVFAAGDPERVRRRWDLAGCPVLLTVGRQSRLQRYKGIDTTLRALPAVLRQVPGAAYLVVGPPADDAEYLRGVAAAGGVADHVRFVGEVEPAALPDYYAACDLFVMPTRTEATARGLLAEGFGMVFLEAAAAGRPAIAGRAGGAPEAVVDGVTGLVVDPDDPGAVADAIVRLLTDRPLAERLGTQARARAEAFAWEQVVPRAQDAVERLLR